MGKIIAFANQKGGVGKTTTAINLAAALFERGKRVLLCDFDPQGNATSGFGVDPRSLETSIYDLIVADEPDVKGAIVSTKWVDLIGANVNLAGAELDLIGMDDRERRLKNVLEQVRGDYDYIFIDCPPSLGLLTLNCLCAADSFLVPRNVRLSEAPSHGKPITDYDRMCRGAEAYLALADEILKKNERRGRG